MTRRKRKAEEPTANLEGTGQRFHGKLRPELLAFAKGRTAEVIRRLEKAKNEIAVDIQANEGIYPYNGGRVTQAEVCRRAGIRKATLQGDAHKSSTKLTVDKFVADILAVKGARSVRRNVTDRANLWKGEHRKIADAYRIDALRYEAGLKKLEQSEAERHALQQQNFDLRTQNVALQKQNLDLQAQLREQLARLSGSNVVPLPKRDA